MAYKHSKRRNRRKKQTRKRSRKAGMFARVGKTVARQSGDVLKEIIIGEAQTKWKGQDTLIDKYDKLQNIKYNKENNPRNVKHIQTYKQDFEL